ncbi:MAG: hypothetical protein J6L62_00330 [Clostridia bacterium]|nr:hypothetical protein [Clostridia bacterium]
MPRCEHCQKNRSEIYKMNGVLQNGQAAEVHLCSDCSYQFIQGKEWFRSSYGLIKSGTQTVRVNNANDNQHVGLGAWASFIKFINVLVLIGSIIIGVVPGLVAGEPLAGIFGGVAGFLIGLTIVSVSMLFVEMSNKLSLLINEVIELKKKL